jgi:hypothetical protein
MGKIRPTKPPGLINPAIAKTWEARDCQQGKTNRFLEAWEHNQNSGGVFMPHLLGEFVVRS